MKQEIERSLTSLSSKKAPMVWDCGSPLYDSFELSSLSHIIERHMMALPPSSSSSSSTRSSLSSSCSSLRSEGTSFDEGLKRKVEWEEVSKKKKAEKRIKVTSGQTFP
ncbi:uncharacterized protein [Spinacia oleracea]|uniref:Uncharacterized protein n=1 Tax=Spinacia oleracea TaxID=3562 RepID=A0A9R0IEK3_SPIOL|nr:uncharacterized protein LOC110786446 [Spinacia oleracea]